jgi:rhodanese-related sulfurtransferase
MLKSFRNFQAKMTEKTRHRNNFKVVVVASFLMIALCFQAAGQNIFVGKAGKEGKVLKKYIEPAELQKIVEHPVDSIWILDVRSEKAYANGHIPTAKSFPTGTVKNRLNEIPKDKYLIIYCTVGGNANIVSKNLKKAGYKRYINWGGLSRWEKETDVPIPGK